MESLYLEPGRKLEEPLSSLFQGFWLKSIFLGIFLLLGHGLSAQTGSARPGTEWTENFGGSDGEEAKAVQQTDDAGYIVAGWSKSNDQDVFANNGVNDVWVVKLDSSGIIQWEENYGGSDGEEARSVQQTFDGGYIVAGVTLSDDKDVSGNNGAADYWILKLDSSGTIQWEENYGGSNGDRGSSVQQTDDGGYILAGNSQSDDGDLSANNGGNDYWVLKLDSAGSLQWEENYGGSYDEEAKSVQQTVDGGYVVTGWSKSNDGDVSANNGGKDYWVLKLDSSGTIQWEGNYGGSSKEEAESIQQTSEGGYIVGGWSMSNDGDLSGNNGDLDYWTVKLDSSGIIQWQGNYGGSDHDQAFGVYQTTDQGYILAGDSHSSDGDLSGNKGENDFWLVKLDSSGVLQWEGNYGGSSHDEALSLQQTDEGGYILAGWTESSDKEVPGNNGVRDHWVLKLDSCLDAFSHISPYACGSYTTPSGDTTYTTSGVYKDSLPFSTGCDSIITIDLTIRTVDTSVTQVSSTELESNENASSYQWLDCENGYSPISGETGKQFTASSNGSYAVEVTVFGCPDTSGCHTINSVGIVENGSEQQVSFYPNPAEEKITIKVSGRIEPMQVTVRDLTGRTISSKTVENASSFRMNLKGEESGMYLIEIRTEDGRREVRKVMKE